MVNDKLRIGLIATDSRKALLSEFCTAYKQVLKSCVLFATYQTGEYIEFTTGLKVNKMLPGKFGGVEQMISKITYKELDAIIYLRASMSDPEYTSLDKAILKECDVKMIPMATNIATAELLIHSVENDDLSWLYRDIEF